MMDFESLTVLNVEYYCKVNPACLNFLQMINSFKKRVIKKSNQM